MPAGTVQPGWEQKSASRAASCIAANRILLENAALDPNRLNTVFASCNVDPATGAPLVSHADGLRHYEIFQGETQDGGLTWTWQPITQDSDCDNIRPVVPIWPSERRVLLWDARPLHEL